MTDKPLTTVETPLIDIDINRLFDKAIEAGSATEVLKELISLSTQIKVDFARASYFQALAAFQADCPIIPKGETASGVSKKTGEDWAYNYETIEGILLYKGNGLSVKELLTRHGFSYRWITPALENGIMTVGCVAQHAQGHSEEMTVPLPVVSGPLMNNVQAHGSTVSYGQRYSFKAVFGIVTTGHDDDAQGAGPVSDPITEVQLDILISMTEGYISTWQTDSKEITKLRKVWMRGLARKAGVKGTKPEAADISSSAFDRSKEWLEAKFKQDKEQREGQ